MFIAPFSSPPPARSPAAARCAFLDELFDFSAMPRLEGFVFAKALSGALPTVGRTDVFDDL